MDPGHRPVASPTLSLISRFKVNAQSGQVADLAAASAITTVPALRVCDGDLADLQAPPHQMTSLLK